MKRKELTPTRIVDYSAARARAIRWLGDRYLLARSINASPYTPRQLTPGMAPAAPAAGAAQPQRAPTGEVLSLAPVARAS